MITPRRLFEIAGIPIPYVLLIEGYKEATAEFSAISPDAPAKIAQYKDLVQRNQAMGDERNIDYWRKQGWEAFVAFVDKKSSGPTKTQLKRKKVVGQSITLREDEEWLIVIPLDKDASCFHGKNSDWCTTKYNQSYFEQYFYDKEVVLIYCLNKTNGGMWALAGHKQAKGKIEIFNQQDNTITAAKLKQQTGLNAAELVKLALAQSEPINKSRSGYVDAKKAATAKLGVLPNGVRDEELERVIATHKFRELAVLYVTGNRQVGDELQRLAVQQNGTAIKFIKNPSEEVQRLAVQQDGAALEFIKNPSDEVQTLAVQQAVPALKFIKNPSEELQRLAVQQDGAALEFIKNPSEELQRLAVQQNGWALEFIKNPSEEVQTSAVQQNGWAIKFIKNPSEEVQRLAVQQNGWAIQFIKNPSDKVQTLAVQQNEHAIQFIKNPSEELQRFVVQRNGYAIQYIQNPSEEVQTSAVQQNGRAIMYIKNPSEELQRLAVQQDGHTIKFIQNPTPAVVALHNELWGNK